MTYNVLFKKHSEKLFWMAILIGGKIETIRRKLLFSNMFSNLVKLNNFSDVLMLGI